MTATARRAALVVAAAVIAGHGGHRATTFGVSVTR